MLAIHNDDGSQIRIRFFADVDAEIVIPAALNLHIGAETFLDQKQVNSVLGITHSHAHRKGGRRGYNGPIRSIGGWG